MTILTGVLPTFTAIGNREDLADKIYSISPTDTPFAAAIEKNNATATKHEWQTDTLDTAATNAQLEGDTFTYSTPGVTTRLYNYTQILYKTVAVSGSQNAINTAGRTREMAYQLVKKTKALKRDIEFALLNNQTPQDSVGAAGTARNLRPVQSWITTNDDGNLRESGGSGGSTTTGATDGTVRQLSEDFLKEALRKAWLAGGEPDLVIAGPVNKQRFSTFAGNATRWIQASDRLVAGVAYYEHDFGTIKVVADRFTRDRDLLIFDTNYWALSTLRAMKTIDTAITADATNAAILAELTLESRNEAASAVVADLST